MQHADDAQCGDKAEGQQVQQGNALEIEERWEVGDAGKVMDERVNIVHVNVIAADKPIGSDDGQQRRPEGSPTHAHDVKPQDDPPQGNEEQRLDEPDAGQADEEERVEHVADGRFVLIGAEHEQVGEGEA